MGVRLTVCFINLFFSQRAMWFVLKVRLSNVIWAEGCMLNFITFYYKRNLIYKNLTELIFVLFIPLSLFFILQKKTPKHKYKYNIINTKIY